MTQQGVNRLKDLLFDRERGEIEELARRVGALHARVGDDARLRQSVALVLDGALRDAEVARHRELADAIAPVVVRTVQTEIATSQDMLVEALYPRLGDLVRRYVVSAFRDLVDDLNRRLESKLPFDTLALKLRSLATGRSMAELALSDTSRFAVEEIYLIRRGSGELLEHWARPGTAAAGQPDESHDQRFSGILAAITAFADESLKGDDADLRTLNVGNRLLYIRASAAHLLAAKCRATAPPPIQTILDDEFIATLAERREGLAAAGSTGSTGSAGTAVARLAGRLETRAREKLITLGGGRGRSGPLKWAALLILAPLLGYLAWQSYVGYLTTATRTAALQVIALSGEVRGYPIRLTVERGGRALALAGLAPSEDARAAMVQRLRAALPDVAVTDQTNVLPAAPGAPDVGPEFAAVRDAIATLDKGLQRSALVQSIGGAQRRIASTADALKALEALVAPGLKDALRAAHVDLDRADGELRRSAERLAASDANVGSALAELSGVLDRLAAVHDRIAGMSGAPPAGMPRARAASLGEAVERLTVLGERISAVAHRLEAQVHAQRLEGAIAGLPKPRDDRPAIAALEGVVTGLRAEVKRLEDELARRPLPAVRVPTPREKLLAFTRSHAIFFGNAAELRDEAAANAALDELARLLLKSNDVVRIVGYADERGAQTRNATVSLARAQRIAAELAARGVPASRLVVVARSNSIEISSSTGPQSANRRVEFEVGFVGEGEPDAKGRPQ